MQHLNSIHVKEADRAGKISFIKSNLADSLEAETNNYIVFGYFSFIFYYMPVIAKSWKVVMKLQGWKRGPICKLLLWCFLEKQFVLFKNSCGVFLTIPPSLHTAQLWKCTIRYTTGPFSIRIDNLQLRQLGKYWGGKGGLPSHSNISERRTA